jgi:hypothetical protein
MRRHISSKSDTYTESMGVYATGISVKVCAHYPGRSDRMFRTAEKVELGTHGATERALAGNSQPKTTVKGTIIMKTW